MFRPRILNGYLLRKPHSKFNKKKDKSVPRLLDPTWEHRTLNVDMLDRSKKQLCTNEDPLSVLLAREEIETRMIISKWVNKGKLVNEPRVGEKPCQVKIRKVPCGSMDTLPCILNDSVVLHACGWHRDILGLDKTVRG